MTSPHKKTVEFKFKIWDKEAERWATAYSRAYHDEEEWDSEDRALNSNCHGIFKDEERYEVVKIKVTREPL